MPEVTPTVQASKKTTHTRPSQPSTRHAIIQLTSLDRYTGLRNHRLRFQDAFDINGERVDKANEQDVVFGRGKSLQDLPGNRRMRQIADKHKAMYRTLQRSQKRNLVEAVYKEIVSNGARFLVKAPNATHYILVDVEVALQKISNSLRCMKAHKRHLSKVMERTRPSTKPVSVLSVSSPAPRMVSQQSICQQTARGGDGRPDLSKKPSKVSTILNLRMPVPLSVQQNFDIMTTLRYLNQCKRLRLTMDARMMSSMAIGRSARLELPKVPVPVPMQEAGTSKSDPR